MKADGKKTERVRSTRRFKSWVKGLRAGNGLEAGLTGSTLGQRDHVKISSDYLTLPDLTFGMIV